MWSKNTMKILIIGNGGRESAIAYGIYNSESFKKNISILYSTIGNPGLDKISTPINIKPTEIEKLIEFAIQEKIDFTVVGPEIPLSLGIVNEFNKKGLKIFGPAKEAAEIETSKIFAKNLMKKYKIPTARFKEFNSENLKEASEHLLCSKYPLVIKADGLAAGKGVIIVNDFSEAMNVIKEFTENKIFGDSGLSFIIEEYLTGFELSLFIITDGKNYVALPFSQDHKKIGEGDTGKNTGGMGAYAPADKMLDKYVFENILLEIIEPTLHGMEKEGRRYKGCLYCGLMITEDINGVFVPYVIEFNARFGDPETQAVVPLIKSDFLDLLISSSNNTIDKYKLEIYDKYSCCVILASKGYPDKYETGKVINGLSEEDKDVFIFQSGTKYSDDRKNVLTNSGRVLSVVAMSENSMKDAISKCYKRIGNIYFDNTYFRKDIGFKYKIKDNIS
jgi:phosphoribosylamine---glycine ligase